ncbi:outer membrane lipid asymmetry maintenance protein MlaD [Pelistega suis]|uniref:outer membrane lipid asymmetry maintenance protein MlaD n=1 Tax=Pelistega suis TaxID=1631957 RepID=UPI00211CAFF5|nr:outer membrane lipid asymmetry maintenance protein MlaD [Pelistega suis]MCQ9329321.1 outer membrane lipid asymmetry maintenance protein MlaD [Pelistega suis]MDY3332078.1 outer membrane lipid asymmetry maintenance protein MlaD [Pelistega sp.]
MQSKKTDFLVGIFVLLGFLAVVFLALKAGNLSTFSFDKTYQVTAKFDNIGSLKARAPVKSNGVVVGRVAEVSFDNNDFRAIVKLNMEAKYAFPKDSSATIQTAGLIGEQYIGITAGAEEEMLKEGSEITYTQSALVLEELVSKFLFSTAEKEGKAKE